MSSWLLIFQFSSRLSSADRCAGGTDLPKVLFKVAELQTLLQLQVVFGPELLQCVLCLFQLSQEPETHHSSVLMLQEVQRGMLIIAPTRTKPLHGGLILHFIRTQFVVLRLGCLLSNAAQQSGALFQRQLQLLLVRKHKDKIPIPIVLNYVACLTDPQMAE